MYEEKVRKFSLDWKSLIVKLLVIFAVLFIALWLFSLVKKDNKTSNVSNIGENLARMQTVALEYFKGSKLPEGVNGKKKISLQEMFDTKLMVEFKDQDGNACDTTNSFAEATKINDEDYTIKVKLVCGEKLDYVIDTVKIKDDSSLAGDKKPEENDNKDDVTGPITNTIIGTITNKPTNSNNNNTSKPTTSTKPSGNTSKPNTSKPNNNNNNTTVKPSTCSYGDKTYTSRYPLAYVIPGDCAVSMNDYYKSDYANMASKIGALEYQKLTQEVIDLKAKTGANLYVDSPIYAGIYNTSNKGLVGYQIMFVVKQKLNYSAKVIYEYYLDQNGNRKAVIDNRSSLNKSNNNTNVNVDTKPDKPSITPSEPESIVTAVVLNQNTLELEVNKSKKVGAVIKGVNVGNKQISWSSGDSSIASVDKYGIITGKKVGATTIFATCDGKVDSLVVTVKENNYLNLNVNDMKISVGDVYKTLYYTNLSDITWSSSNTYVATVDSTGRVVAKNPGVTVISATAGEIKVSYTVTVTSVKKESIKFYDTSVQLMPGFTKTLYYEISNPYNRNIVWSSENPNIATVKDGIVTAVNPGSTVIRARLGSSYTAIVVYVY